MTCLTPADFATYNTDMKTCMLYKIRGGDKYGTAEIERSFTRKKENI